MADKNPDTSKKKDLIAKLLEAYKDGLREQVHKEVVAELTPTIEAQFSDDIARLQEEIESLQTENTCLVNDIEKLRQNAEFFAEEQELMTSEHTLIKFQLSESQEEVEGLKKKAHTLIEKEKHLQTTILNLKKELTEQRSKMEELVTHVTHENEIYKEKITILDTDKNSLSALLSEKDHTITDLQNKIAECIRKELEIQGELANYLHTTDSDRHEHEERIRELEIALHKKELTITTMDNDIKKIETLLKEKEVVAQKAEERALALTDVTPPPPQPTVDDSQITELQSSLDNASEEVGRLHNEISKLQTELTNKETEVKTLQEEIKTLLVAREEEMQMVQALLKKKS